MTFDASRIQDLSKQISSAQNGFKTASRLHAALQEASRPSAFGSILQNIAKPSTVANVSTYQNIASAGLRQHRRAMQNSFGLTSSPVASAVRDTVHSMASYHGKLFQTKPSQLAFSKLQVTNGFNVATLNSRVQSFNKMANLARDLARPYDLREGDFISSLGGFTATLQQLNSLTFSSAFGMVQGIQSQRTPPIALQVARAVSEGARASSGWKPLLDDLKEYRLREVRVRPISREDTMTPTPPIPPADGPDDTEPHPVPTPDAVPVQGTSLETPGEEPFQLDGKWWLLRPLQPVENVVYGVLNGPLVVKILAIGLGQLVVMVIGSGLVYFLFYCC